MATSLSLVFSGLFSGIGLPCFPAGLGGEQLRPLIQNSLTAPTWSSHGKAWEEWQAAGQIDLVLSKDNCFALTFTLLDRLCT